MSFGNARSSCEGEGKEEQGEERLEAVFWMKIFFCGVELVYI